MACVRDGEEKKKKKKKEEKNSGAGEERLRGETKAFRRREREIYRAGLTT